MKRIYFLLIAVFVTLSGLAQGISDGLTYGSDNPIGTARFNAMSGAFGALGGDLSAMGINPAGSAVFLNNSASISFAISNVDNTSRYFNTVAESSDSELSLNQAGIVFVFNTKNEESPWKKVTVGLNYGNSQNFDADVLSQGTGTTSIANFFTQQAQGIPLDLLQLRPGETVSNLYNFLGQTQGVGAQNAFLGYQAFVFDPVTDDPDNSNYVSNVGPGNFNQQYSYLTQGYAGKYTINVATQYKDKLFFGINLNSHVIDYQRSSFLFETNNNPGSTIREIGFENNLSTLGSGFSAQLGAILKFDDFRLGLTYDTPTWFNISEETSQYLETRRTENNQSIVEVIDPNVINVFANYDLQTPGKITASGAYIFGKSGLISLDYSLKDYSNLEFSPENDVVFAAVNRAIDMQLTSASTVRVGGEYRINQLSLRGGFMYEESPFANEITVGDTTGFSLGLGYNFGNYSFDLSYARAEQDRVQQLYSIGLTDSTQVNTVTNNVVFTLGLNL